MNLIGHMTCAERFSGEAQLGAMLPDLLSLYDRRIRPMKIVRAHATGSNGGEAGLQRGMRFHFYVDSHFHRSSLFRDGCAVIRDRLIAASATPGLKRFAVAHILTELFLDHLLIVDTPERLAAFYDVLRRGEASVLEMTALPDTQVDWADFADFLTRLISGRFADGYLEMESLFHRMDRILPRLRQRTLERRERDALAEGLAAHADRARKQLALFVRTMQTWDGSAEIPARPPSGDTGAPDVDASGPAGIE